MEQGGGTWWKAGRQESGLQDKGLEVHKVVIYLIFTSAVCNCTLDKVDQKTSTAHKKSSSRLLRPTHQLHKPYTPTTMHEGIGTSSKEVRATACNVNACDWLEHTDLHHAVSSLEPVALKFVKPLLDHPQIDINMVGSESQIGILHKDFEGYTVFDTSNSKMRAQK